MSESEELKLTGIIARVVGIVVGAMAFGPMMWPASWLFEWMMAQPSGNMIGLLLLGPYILAQTFLLVGVPFIIGAVTFAAIDEILK